MAAAGMETSEKPVMQLNDKQLREALDNFTAMDKNGDGALSRAEFREGLGMLGVDDDFSSILFNMFDAQGTGSIDRSAFLTSMAVMLHPDEIEMQVGLAFDAYDLNKDGKLDLAELTQVVAAMNSAIAKMGIVGDSESPERIAEELFLQMDRDGKGYVTKTDYLQLAKANPGAAAAPDAECVARQLAAALATSLPRDVFGFPSPPPFHPSCPHCARACRPPKKDRARPEAFDRRA
jgi:Ca2+-binding EF-hand superfamily protein